MVISLDGIANCKPEQPAFVAPELSEKGADQTMVSRTMRVLGRIGVPVLAVHANRALGVEPCEPNPITGSEKARSWAERDGVVSEAVMIKDRDHRRVDEIGEAEDGDTSD